MPRCEYPRPNLVREGWLCLNGEWEFKIDNSRSGKDLDFKGSYPFESKITVPFCPESSLSGIGNTDYGRVVPTA